MGISNTKDLGASREGTEREKEAFGFALPIRWPHFCQLLLVVGVALAFRIYAFATTLVIARDGTFYIENAGSFQKGEFAKAIARGLKPLYPFLIWVVYGPTGDWEISGKVVSLLFGTAATVALYFLARKFWEREIALLAALIFAVHPSFVQYSAEVLSESTYIFFFLMAMAAASVEIHRDRLFPWGVLYVTMVICAALTRPEGIFLMAVVILSTGLRRYGLFSHERRPLRFLMVVGSQLMLLAAIFTGIYIFLTSSLSSPIASGTLWAFEGIERRAQMIMDEALQTIANLDGIRAVNWFLDEVWKDFLLRFIEAAHPAIFLLAMIGLWKGGKERRWNYIEVTLATFLIYVGGLFVVNMMRPGLSMSHRYFLGAVSILVPWAAFGLLRTSLWISRRFEAFNSRRWTSPKVLAGLTGFLLLVFIGKTLPFHRGDKVGIRKTGERIGQLGIPNVKIISPDPRIAFYAKGTHVNLPELTNDGEKLIRLWRNSEADVAAHRALLIAGDARAFIVHAEQQGIQFLDVVHTTGNDSQQAFFVFRLKKE